MALERQSIEKKDFPIGRRGYDPDAVDAHLAGIAEQVDELKRAARRRSETLASSASEQVRAIVEAAENSAAQIQRQAEEEAADIRTEASTEAQTTRQQATEQAREYVGKVSESTAVMLQRLDAMESELGALIESLRTGANRLNADLHLLEGNLTELTEAAAPRPRFEPEPASQAAPPLSPPVAPAPPIETAIAAPVDTEPPQGDALLEGEPEHDAAWELEHGHADDAVEADEYEADLGDGGAGAADDAEGARLIALNMALNGTPREETDRYLADNFNLADRAALLDEVYASVDG